MMSARWWKSERDGEVSCGLCFRRCRIRQGASGKCGVRVNDGGTLVSPMLGKFCACAVDPVEKKPLYHWRPGGYIYSLGSLGCTMDCPFCQNNRITFPADSLRKSVAVAPELPPSELAENVRALGLSSVAFTYNEPMLQAEYICTAADVLHDSGIALALVTNGAMSSDAAKDILSCLSEHDAANIDIKAFTPHAYGKLGGSLETVKRNIEAFIEAGVHVELTNLVVPGMNDDVDDFAAMVEWIASLSRDIPLHVTRYFPARNYHEPPTNITFLHTLASLASKKLKHVHVGNV